MSITQKSINKGFALGVLGLYAFSFGATLGAKTHEYTRVIGDYNVNNVLMRSVAPTYQVRQDVALFNNNIELNYLVNGDDSVDNNNSLTTQCRVVYLGINGVAYNVILDSSDYNGSATDLAPQIVVDDQYYGGIIYTPRFQRVEGGLLSSCFGATPFLFNHSFTYNNEQYIIDGFQFYYFVGEYAVVSSSTGDNLKPRVNAYGDVIAYGTGGLVTGNQFDESTTVFNANDYLSISPYTFVFYTLDENNNVGCMFDVLCNFSTGVGYSQGYTAGYSDGVNYVLQHPTQFDLYDYASYLAYGQSRYNAGLEAGSNVLSLSGVMNSIFTAPISMFMQIFRSGAFVWTMPTGEVLDLGGLMTFFLTIGIALAVVRLIMKVGGK